MFATFPMISRLRVTVLATALILSACVSAPPKPSIGGHDALRYSLFRELCFYQPDNRNARIRVFNGHERGFLPLVDIRFDGAGLPVEVSSGVVQDTFTYGERTVRRERMKKGEVFQVVIYSEDEQGNVQFDTIQGAPQNEASGTIVHETNGLLVTYRETYVDKTSGRIQGINQIVVSEDGRPIKNSSSGFGLADSGWDWVWQGNRLERLVEAKDGEPKKTVEYHYDLSGRVKTVTFIEPGKHDPIVNEVGYD